MAREPARDPDACQNKRNPGDMKRRQPLIADYRMQSRV
jgi:hypothetical protein